MIIPSGGVFLLAKTLGAMVDVLTDLLQQRRFTDPEVRAALADAVLVGRRHRDRLTQSTDAGVSASVKPAPAPREWSTQEVADCLGVTPHNVRDLARRNRLRGYQEAGRWRFPDQDVRSYMEETA